MRLRWRKGSSVRALIRRHTDAVRTRTYWCDPRTHSHADLQICVCKCVCCCVCVRYFFSYSPVYVRRYTCYTVFTYVLKERGRQPPLLWYIFKTISLFPFYYICAVVRSLTCKCIEFPNDFCQNYLLICHHLWQCSTTSRDFPVRLCNSTRIFTWIISALIW